jgi:anthranilate synthase/aminodeoxychorismate synthase-like glutamine amidotransferase
MRCLDKRVLLVDNYDSFTFNLKQLFLEFTDFIEVIPNDDPILLAKQDFTHLVLSPGPGDPSHSGFCKDLIKKWAGKKPVLGVCLGHQIIAEVYGGRVVKAPYPLHGKVSFIMHNGRDLFFGLKQGLQVARYHSLVVERENLPKAFHVVAECDNIIMALTHTEYPGLYGVQFHPESFLSESGSQMINNFFSGSSL